jgi:hypothetical protein
MKILITGYTTRMFGSMFIRNDYVTFSFLLEDILKEMGHTVERRKILIGEEINHVYDYAFCGVAPLSSMTSGRVCETHYVMDCMPGRHVVYADDWSFCSYGDSVRYTLDKWDKYLNYKKFPYAPHIIERTRESLELMASVSSLTNAPVLAPMFPWGDHQFLMTGTSREGNYDARLVTVDPSNWLKYPSIDVPYPRDKVRQWVMAALSDHSKWVNKQGFKLPVLYCGNKRMEGTQVLSEKDTVKLFANSYGVLSTGYPSAGSGWWRTRYLNAAWAESIIYSDPKDAAVMGRPYQGSVEFYENIDTESGYEYAVAEQAAWLYRSISPKEEVMATFERLMKK